MRSRRTALVGVFVCLLAYAGTAFAQEQSGSIQGVVKDSSGSVLPGATVEVRSAAGVGVNSATSDSNGVYRFPALAPGSYEVSATLTGFSPAKISDAVLTLGKSLTIDLVLKIAGVTEQVTVTATSPLIDVKQNAGFASIQRETIARIPKGRDFQSVLKQAPGAMEESKSGGIQVDGASGSENRFIIDGMDTTNLQNGTSGKTMLLDFVQEVQVKSSGYNAEFGGATGGVVNVITKSGTNNLHGQAGSYYNSNQFFGDRRPSIRFNPQNTQITETGLLTPDEEWRYKSPFADLGGPILKDKLWFYAGIGYTKNDYARDVTFYTDPAQLKRHFTRWTDTKYYNYNGTTQLSNSMRLKVTGSNQRDASRRANPAPTPDNAIALLANSSFPAGVASKGMSLSTFDKNADGTVNQTLFDNRWVKQGSNAFNNTYSGNFDWVVKPSFFVNLSAGSYFNNNTTPAEFRGNEIRHTFSTPNNDAAMLALGYPTVPVQFQNPSGYTDFPTNAGTVRNIFTRRYVNANTTWFKSAGGQHTVKAGMRFERFGNDVLDGAALPNISINWGQAYTNPETGKSVSGKYGYYTLNQTGTIGKVFSNNYSFWVQDAWNVTSRLTVNAGVRTENEHIPSFKDQKQFPDALSIEFGFKDKIAPRLGFAYDVNGDGKWKTYGSFGYFYDITKLELPRGSFGGDHWVDYVWSLDTADFTTLKCSEGTTGCPGTYIGPPNGYDLRHSSNQVDDLFAAYFSRPGMTGIDPNLKPVKAGEFTTGLEHELRPTMSIGLRYVHKWMLRTIEDTGIYVNGVEDYLIANPGEGLAVTMEPAFPAFPTPKPVRKYDSVELKLNRRFANNWSGGVSYTYSRLWGNYSGLASADENGRVSPNVNRYYDNTLMSYGSNGKAVYGVLPTDRPHALKLQGTYDFKWGTQVGAFWFIESGIPQTTVVRFAGYPAFVYGRNDLGRSPKLSQLDMNIAQNIKIVGDKRIQLQANIDNVLDQDTWTALYPGNSYGPTKYVSNTGGYGNIALAFSPTPPPVLYQPGGYNVDAIAASYIASGGSLKANPFYTTPNVFQGRRQIRISAKFTF